MSDCPLPTTGSDAASIVVLVAYLVLGAGIVLWLIGRRRRVGGGTAIIIALALGATTLAIGDDRTADAATCPSPTTTAAAADSATTTSPVPTTTITTTIPTTTTTTTTTTAPTTTTSTSTTAPTTTTTTAPSTSTSTSSTTSTTSTTTTTVPLLADLTPTITGPTTAVPGVRGGYTLRVANVGTGPTSGQMAFTLAFTLDTGSGTLAPEALGSNDWTFVGSSGGNLNYVSNPGLTLAPGEVSATTFGVTWSPQLPSSGSFTIATTLPIGIGGETNAANNSASVTVVVSPPPG